MAKNPDEMSFLEHLEELRWRIVRAVIAVVVFGLVAFIFKGFIFDTIILGPKDSDFITYKFFCRLGHLLGMEDSLCITNDFSLQNISMAGQFTSHIMVSAVSGLIIAFPYVFYQIWGFIAPGLRTKERKSARGTVLWVTLLFLIGVLFGYYILAPLSVQFLGNYHVSSQVQNIISLNSYISTVTTVTLACGIVFQLPIVIYFLAKLGVVNASALRSYRKHAIVVILVVSAVITPPDITSQILVSLPLMLLYESSIYIAKFVERQNRKALGNGGKS